jgi:cysteine desulfurase
MIYLDNAATTPICEAARKAILDNLDDFYNPNSSYEAARKVKVKVEEAREKIADLIGAQPNEIYFTSGGSESDTWVTSNGIVLASNIEHHAMCPHYKFNVDYQGLVDCEKFEKRVHELLNDAFCVYPTIASCMLVNNELGAIEPIQKLAEIAHDNMLRFHTDAVQAIPHMRINVKELGVDMLSCSAHKFGGVKGCGFLYVKNDVYMRPLINGGSQEQGARGGTTNVLGVLAMAAALEDTVKNMDKNNAKIKHLSDKMKSNMLNVKGVIMNGPTDKKKHLDGILNFRIEGVRGADVVAMADEFGIAISAGSACNEGNAEPSHVLKAIGLTDEEALSSIRISIGRNNTEAEIDYVCEMLPKIIERLRLFNI